MNADGKVIIETELNTDGAAKGAKDLKGQLGGANSSLGGLVKSAGKFAKVAGIFGTVAVAVKGAVKVIKETTQAYEKQLKAEVQLEAAAKNNPYLSKQNVRQLKDFAGELQKIGTIGDEELMPLMAQLASTGRTQAEIQQIMSAALDVSASGVMSLDSAVQSLNATYSGNVGALGRQISELKGLTDEELKSGKAIEIVAQKFKGMSKEVTAQTGSAEQLANAWGDFKENIGRSFEKPISSMRKFFTQLITGWNDASAAKKKYQDAKDAEASGEELQSDQLLAIIETDTKKLEMLKKVQQGYDAMSAANKRRAGITEQTIANNRKQIEELEKSITEKNKELADALKKEKELAEAEKARARAQAAADEADAKQRARMKARDEYDATIKAAEREIELRRSLGETITEEAEASELLNVATAAYLKMVTDPSFEGNSLNYSHEKNAREYIKGLAAKTTLPADEFEELKKALGEISKNESADFIESLNTQLQALDQLAEGLDHSTDLYKEYAEKRKILEEEIAEAQKQSLVNQINTLNSFAQKYGEIADSITSLWKENNEAQTESELGELSEQYNNGLISYEEYCDEKAKIQKKAAQEEYKYNMFAWTAQLLQATANTASGVASALAEVGVPTAVKYVNAALMAAAGAVQIATITANKPKPPSFATGGIVGGSSYTGDRVQANVNSGEMILNAQQQRQLWNVANGGGGGAGVSLNVQVVNNMGREARVNSQLSANGLRVTIDKAVNTSMSEGKYTNSMNIAQQREQGVKLL